MTKKIQLKAEKRSEKTPKAKELRLEKIIPGVIYGFGGESESISVKKLDIERALDQGGETHLIDLEIGGEKPIKVIIKDVQTEPVRGTITHIDLYRVDMTQKIEVEVPIEFEGESKAVKDLGGTLIRSFETARISCLPGDLPENFVVSLESLNTFDDATKMSDIKVPQGVEILHDDDEVIASVSEPRVIEEDEDKEEGESTAEGQGKEEGETKEGEPENKEENKG